MTTYLFPGQGSQSKGMGAGLFEQFPELTAQADEILGYSIAQMCLIDEAAQLGCTEITQPALFVVNALTYFNAIKSAPNQPHYLAGHSLGEYNALLAAEVFDFATGLKLVMQRGLLMSQTTHGAMAAVVGLSAEKIEALCAEHGLNDMCVANYNSNNQLVLSGDREEISQALILCKAAGAKIAKLLNVSGAFHSPLMQQAQDAFADFLQPFDFAAPKIPVIANVSAQPYPQDSESIKKLLITQITSPVRWVASIQYLFARGEDVFEEIGPGTVLTGLMKRIKNGQ
jgi:malonyl CoA-acyl carrier protein transacylase